MWHGLGLTEFAACCCLSPSQIENILKHGHARNNRSLLFAICAALIIHTSDMIQLQCPDLKDALQTVLQSAPLSTVRNGRSKLMICTTDTVTHEAIECGRLLRERVEQFFSNSSNGKHVVRTVLLTCLLPTIGFHVLSRTGHTDVLDSFWLRLNSVLHTSVHMKYQELYLYYMFFQSIMPRASFNDLFTNKPGAMVGRVPSFTGGMGFSYDRLGWSYVHLDELLEMLIVRLVKGLNVVMLPYLELAGAWLLVVSKARMLIRSVTASTHSYRRLRTNGDSDQESTPAQQYDRGAIQSSSVRDILHLMRQKGYLSDDHRNSETLRNLGANPEDLNDTNVQDLILNLDSYGQKSVELHASSLFPDIFGPLSESDITEHLNCKRFRGAWTKQRQVPTCGSVMGKQREKDGSEDLRVSTHPKKSLSERRHAVTKLMTSLTLAEHAAIAGRDHNGAENARKRWHVLHSARYLMSPYADAYRGANKGVRHARKSKMLLALNTDFSHGNEEQALASNGEPQPHLKGVSNYYDYTIPQYASVMVDIMNQIWTRGTDGRRGNPLFHVTLLKLKSVLSPWFTGGRSKKFRQLHLHIDDSSIVIPQKRVSKHDGTVLRMKGLP